MAIQSALITNLLLLVVTSCKTANNQGSTAKSTLSRLGYSVEQVRALIKSIDDENHRIFQIFGQGDSWVIEHGNNSCRADGFQLTDVGLMLPEFRLTPDGARRDCETRMGRNANRPGAPSVAVISRLGDSVNRFETLLQTTTDHNAAIRRVSVDADHGIVEVTVDGSCRADGFHLESLPSATTNYRAVPDGARRTCLTGFAI